MVLVISLCMVPCFPVMFAGFAVFVGFFMVLGGFKLNFGGLVMVCGGLLVVLRGGSVVFFGIVFPFALLCRLLCRLGLASGGLHIPKINKSGLQGLRYSKGQLRSQRHTPSKRLIFRPTKRSKRSTSKAVVGFE